MWSRITERPLRKRFHTTGASVDPVDPAAIAEAAPVPVETVAPAPKRAKRTFASLCAKHGVKAVEAAALAVFMGLPDDQLVDPDDFTASRAAFRSAPAGR